MSFTSTGGSSGPRIMVFRPTMEEFKDFPKYIQKIESYGAQKAGVAKIIPPEGWCPRKNGYDDITLTIPAPISQVVSGRQGLYQQFNIQKKAMTVKEFQKLAEGPKFRTPVHFDYEDLERKYWKNIAFNSPIYGADVSGSLYDKGVEEFNIQHLNTILDLVKDDYEIQIEGVNTAYLYFGMWKTTFAWHTEDMDLYSINYLHFGAPKSWYAIPPEHGRRLERLAANFFHGSSSSCNAFLRHKMTIISPQILKQYCIPFSKITQEPGEFMITFPYGYHSGFNHGFNCAESTNFATPRWVEYGKRAVSCNCRNDCVKICMDMFVRKFQPDRYELWKAGKDVGAHPEDPSRQYAAPAPRKLELALAAQREERRKAKVEVDTSTKLKRHPISKLGKNSEKFKIEPVIKEIQEHEDCDSKGTEIYDMDGAEEIGQNKDYSRDSLDYAPEMLYADITEPVKQVEISTTVCKDDHMDEETEMFEGDSSITSDSEEDLRVAKKAENVSNSDISNIADGGLQKPPNLTPFWNPDNQKKASIGEDVLSKFPSFREAINSGALALTFVSTTSPNLSSLVSKSVEITSPESIELMPQIWRDVTASVSKPMDLGTETHDVSASTPKTPENVKPPENVISKVCSPKHNQLTPVINLKKLYVCGNTSSSSSSGKWKCEQTQGLKVRLAKQWPPEPPPLVFPTLFGPEPCLENDKMSIIEDSMLQPITDSMLSTPQLCQPYAEETPITRMAQNDSEMEFGTDNLMNHPAKPADNCSKLSPDATTKIKKEHKRHRSDSSTKNVKAANDRVGNWAHPILKLWHHCTFDFEEEQKFNQHCSTVEPHCAVCMIFSPCNITNGYPNPPIQVPANSKVKMPAFCFGNGLDNQIILDSNPLLARDGTSPLLVCSVCKVCVHASCYGVTMLQLGSWTCSRCSSAEKNIECCLCVMRGGALKRTDNGRWAHLICAILIPETYFENVIVKEPINVSKLESNRQRLKCKYCLKSEQSKSSIKGGACVQCLSGKCYLPFHVTCGYMAGVIYVATDWPEPLNIICTRHSAARRKPTKRTFTDIKTGDKVLAKNKKLRRYYWVHVRQTYIQEYYSILFEDNSTSTNTLPEDIVHREVTEQGVPPNINEKIKVKWTDNVIYNATFKGSRSCTIYVVEFDDGTLVTQERHQIYAADENIPKEIHSKIGTATESRLLDFKSEREGKRIRISNSKYKCES